MEENKISVAEIEELRQTAEAERSARKKVKGNIAMLQLGINISTEEQMSILLRGKHDEIHELLKAYAGETRTGGGFLDFPTMSPEAQLYIYENWKTGPHHSLSDYLIKKVPYTDEFAKRLIDDGWHIKDHKLSESVEMYYLETMLKNEDCQKKTNGYDFCTKHFEGIRKYICEKGLEFEAERYLLMNYLRAKGKEEYVKACQDVVEEYIKHNPEGMLSPTSERVLLATNNHEMIMLYINTAKNGLREEQSLLARANREEVIAYFKRYATLH